MVVFRNTGERADQSISSLAECAWRAVLAMAPGSGLGIAWDCVHMRDISMRL